MRHALILGFVLLSLWSCRPGDSPYNFSEREVPDYELPPLLQQADGSPITNVEEWESHAAELKDIFLREVYGFVPEDGQLDSLTIDKQESSTNALGGIAIRHQYQLRAWRQGRSQAFDLLIYLPVNVFGPVPIFLGLNFSGNQTIHPDPAIWLTESWVRNDSTLNIFDQVATEASRGTLASRWPLETILARGYGLATVYCSDIVPDYPRGFGEGIYPLFYREGQEHPDSSQWGAIGAWAWGLSQTLNFLETIPAINAGKVALIGHSRLGKTALLAGVMDPRFAMVVANNSGCAGAALYRRRFGETIDAINDIAPHWFNDRFPFYRNREEALAVDQHQFLALLAPRPLYVGSAEADLWTDPRGEYLGAYHASPAYEFYGYEGLTQEKSPKVDRSRNLGRVGYHVREGKHDLTLYDWEQYLDFADRWVR